MTNMLSDIKQKTIAAYLKASILSSGIKLTDNLLQNYGDPYLVKRRAYGNQDPLNLRNISIPQEIFLSDEVVVAVNVRNKSPWTLDFENNCFYVINDNLRIKSKVDFPLKPKFYNLKLKNNRKVNQIITLYGGRSLGIFVYSSCCLVKFQKGCHYCSIKENRSKKSDFIDVVDPKSFEEAITIALENCPQQVNQIMINGGIFENLDNSFKYYMKLVDIAIKKAQKYSKEVHLISFPPLNLKNLDLIRDKNFKLAMNIEIINEKLFNKYCPGKKELFGQKNIFLALEKASKILGEGNVNTITVGGLDTIEDTEKGLNQIANLGTTPVINVFHPDPETPLANHRSPSTEKIMEMGRLLQNIYNKNSYMKPFYWKCGRNSLDTEAYLNKF